MIESPAARRAVAGRRAAPGASAWWRIFVRNRPLAVGTCLTAVVILVAISAPYLAPYDPLAIHPDRTLAAPSHTFPVGTDDLGRDNLSRDIYGARLSLVVGLGAVVVGLAGGLPWGLASGLLGGGVDYFLMRFADVVLVFPGLILALVIRALLGPSVGSVIMALGVTIMPGLARIVRGEMLSLRERDFVTAAVAIGARGPRILLRHIMPNILDLLVVNLLADLSYALLDPRVSYD